MYYLISLFFGVWGLLFSSLFPPSFGALSLYSSTYNLVRFLGEWSQNLIAFFEWRTLVFVIFVFEKIIVDFCCCLCRRCLSLSYTIFVFPCFCMWTGSVSISLFLTCIPLLNSLPVPSVSVCVWYGSAAIVLIGLYAASDACWLAEIHFLVLYSHSWSCDAPIFGCV